MKIASFAALLISFASTPNGASIFLRRAASDWPIDTHVSVTTQSAPSTAFAGSLFR